MRSVPGPFCALALAALAAAGCGETVKLVPVEGVVKINGKPASNIAVQFMPDSMKGGKGPTSFAMSGEDGTFKLKTYDGRDGAVVGPHRVVLSDLDEERPAQGKALTKLPRLDHRFALPNDGLEADVQAGKPVELNATGPRQ